jgi:zinc protease
MHVHFPFGVFMTNSLLRKALISAFSLTVACHVFAADNLQDPVPVAPDVKIGKLANGLTYYIKKNGKPEKHVELRLVVKAGSILEDDDQQGLAHFNEHMAFDGSKHFDKHELISYLESIGVKFGADLNAYTSFDETVYILPIPTDKKENLETGFRVLEDWAQGDSLKDDAIDAERPIVLEEARLGKGAGDRISRKLLPEIFNGSQYANRLPIGKEDLLKTFHYDVLRRFYHDWYRPDLMAVVVVGDVEPEQAEKMIKEHFAQLVNPERERPRDYVKIAARSDSKGLVITDKEVTSNLIQIRYPIQATPPSDTIGDYRDSLVRQLYTAMLNQRLQELTQQESPPFLAANSGFGTLARGYEAYTGSVVVGRGGAAPAINALVQEQEKVRQFGFSADELERAKKDMLRNYERMYNERDKSESSSFAAECIRNFLVQEPMPGVDNESRYGNEFIPGISLDEVNRYAARETPSDGNKLVSYLGSNKEGEIIPTEAQLLSLVNAAEKAPVTAKVQKAVATSLMAEPPKAGSIVGERKLAEIGVIELTLSNGVKVILKPTDFKNDDVSISAMRFGGQSLLDDKYTARYAAASESVMGVNGFSPTELQKVLAGKSVAVQANSGLYVDHIGGSAGSSDIETMLQLLYLRMTSPRRDDTLFKAFVSRSQDSAKNAMARPESVFEDSAIAALYNDHPRLQRMAKPEDFTHIDLDKAAGFFNQRFGSAKDLTFIMVGSFDVEKVKPLLASYLGGLPVADVVAEYRDLGIRPVTGVVKKDIHVGTEPKSKVEIAFTGPMTYSLEGSTRFYMLLEVLNLRINDVLREKLSLIYSGGVSGQFERTPYPHYAIVANLPCAPENTDKVAAALFAEIEKLKTEGPQLADISKVKQQWLEQHKIDLRTNSYWQTILQDATLYGTNPANVLSFETRVYDVSAAQLQELAKQYFNQENYAQFVQYPESVTK